MRKKTRDELPNPNTFRHGNYKTAAERKVSNERVDLIGNPKLTGRDAAIAALAKMKELERKRKKKMVSVRVDDKTIISSSKSRIKELVERYRK